MMILLIVWLVRAGSMRRDLTDRGREILAERLAKGELSIEEYQERVRQPQ